MDHFGKEIRRTAKKIGRGISNCPHIKALNECSGVNSFFLYSIYKNDCLYQKDLEQEFGITRSTASKIVSLMEKKNLVARVSDSPDKRLKKLVLTSKGMEIIKSIEEDVNNYETQIIKGFSKEEIDTLIHLLHKVNENIDNLEV